MPFVARKSDSSCTEVVSPALLPADPPSPGTGERITITAPVGYRGSNRREDTRKIQDALNRVPADQGRASPPLDTDGLCGPKTIKAIQMFQLEHFGFKGADGLVEPGRVTIAQINVLLGGAEFPDMTPVVERTRAWLLLCDKHLDLVNIVLDRDDTSGGFEVFGREATMRLVNEHFSLDAFPNRRQMFEFVRSRIRTMQQVLERPGGLWGAAAFDRDPLGKGVQAYTVMGGFFHNGQFLFANGKRIRADAIYLTARFANELRDDDRRTFVVIHELAHFVAFPQPIGDHAHNKQGDKIRNLPPNLKVINAESYANFAWEVVHGQDAPVF